MLELTKEFLCDFEKEVADIYQTGQIKAPIHLRDGNELNLIQIFLENFSPGDIVYSSWASHLHALCAGIPAEKVMQAIIDGKSITLCFPEHNFFASAIVGGSLPIAVGHAWALKNQGKKNKVLCFIGDMTFHTGIAHESIKYALAHDLPIIFIIEDNGKSVGTPTESVWGIKTYDYFLSYQTLFNLKYSYLYSPDCTIHTMTNQKQQNRLIYYNFTSTFPHSGTGKFVSF